MVAPYVLNSIDSYSYEFVTDQDLRYLVYFKYNKYLFAGFPSIRSFIYDFSIEVLDGIPDLSTEDPRIAVTVFEAFSRFFSAVENVAVYVCDSSDNRQKARARKFDVWFFRLSDGSITKKNGTILVEETIIYTSILVHNDNVQKEEILKAFDELNGEMVK